MPTAFFEDKNKHFYLFYSKCDELLEKRDPFVYFLLYFIIKM